MSFGQFFVRPPPGQELHCPNCGASIQITSAKECWLCHEELAPRQTAIESVEGKQLTQSVRLPERRRESTALMVVGFLGVLLLAVGAVLAIEAPGILIVLLFLAAPAVIRTVLATSRDQPEGSPRNGLSLVGTFLGSLGAIMIAGLAAYVAWGVACFVVFFGGVAAIGRQAELGVLIFGGIVGSVLALFVFFVVIRKFWKRKG